MCGAGSMSTSSPNTRTSRGLCSEPSEVPDTDIAPPVPATATVMSRGKSGMPDSRVSAAVTPSSAATHLGVDEVDRRAGAVGEHAAEHAEREQARVVVGHAAAVGDLDGVDGLAGELHEQPAEPGAEAHVRHELVGVVAGRGRHVDGAAQEPAAEDGGDLLGHGDAGAAARVGGGGLGGAREQQARRGEQRRRTRRAGLDGDGGAGQTAAGERRGERLGVDGVGRARADERARPA